MRRPVLLDPRRLDFPPPEHALREPDGLLAVGGDLSPQRLLAAYRLGIFPWFGEGDPILWWSPDPRCVFRTEALHIPRRLARSLRRSRWTLSIDSAFARVIDACAAPRADAAGTWITAAMRAAYLHLHELGHAHSFEVWEGTRLIGGMYGVAVGELFAGESMFSAASGGSRTALLAAARLLARWGWPLIDAQVANPHLLRMGAIELPRPAFLDHVATLAVRAGRPGCWSAALPWRDARDLMMTLG